MSVECLFSIIPLPEFRERIASPCWPVVMGLNRGPVCSGASWN